MSNDNTPQRPWSPGPWAKKGEWGVSAPGNRMVATTAVYNNNSDDGRSDRENVANARAIATFPELYEAAAAYRDAVYEFEYTSLSLIDGALDGARTQEEYGELEGSHAAACQALAKAQQRLDAALAAALPPEDDTP